MSLEENKAIVRKMIEEYNKRNFDKFDDLVVPPINYKVWKASKNYLTWVAKAAPIGMKLLKRSLLKGIRCGFVLLIRGPIQANFLD